MDTAILKLLGQPDYKPIDIPELLKELKLKPEQHQELKRTLRELEKHGLVIRTKGQRYIISREAGLIPGVIQITRGGRGFVQPDEPGIGEIGIPEKATGTAMHGDHVLVRLDMRPKGLHKTAPETSTGAVARILERKRTHFVGT
ncbi:MAG TPA: ribonuclease R, partial [Prosthecobacter sp.]|nr:ribonuclease R [Prosthecobacter sp.]